MRNIHIFTALQGKYGPNGSMMTYIEISSKSAKLGSHLNIYILNGFEQFREKLKSFNQIELAALVKFVDLVQFVLENLFKPFDMMLMIILGILQWYIENKNFLHSLFISAFVVYLWELSSLSIIADWFFELLEIPLFHTFRVLLNTTQDHTGPHRHHTGLHCAISQSQKVK